MSSRKWLLLLLLLFSHCCVMAVELRQLTADYSQYSALLKADPHSLIQLFEQDPEPTKPLAQAQRKLMLSLAYFGLSHGQQALNSANQGLALITEQQQPWLWHQLQLARSMAYDITGSPGTGFEQVTNALAFARAEQDIQLEISSLYVRGQLLISLVDYITALTDLQRAYQLALKHPHPELHAAEVAGMIALVYEYRREDKLAIPYFQQAVDYHRVEQYWLELSIALYGLGRAYKNTGDLDKGLSLLRESALVAEQVDDRQGMAYANKEIAGIELQQGKLSQAKQRFENSLTIFDEAENNYMQLDVNISLIKLALQQKDAELARRYLVRAQQVLKPDTMPIHAIELDVMTSKILSLEQQYAQAYDLLLISLQRSRALLTQQSTEQLHQLRVKYDLDSKAAENAFLQRQNELQQSVLVSEKHKHQLYISVIIFICLLLILLTLLLIRARQHKLSLQQLAEVDGLTLLFNRRKILELLQVEQDVSIRNSQPLTVAVLDLDWFKQINEQFGHQFGDKMLQAFADLCRQQLRHTDAMGRIGDTEFLIVLPQTELNDAVSLMEKICTQTRLIPAQQSMNKVLKMSVSIGIACVDEPILLGDVLSRADKALYRAKKQGRDQIVKAIELLDS